MLRWASLHCSPQQIIPQIGVRFCRQIHVRPALSNDDLSARRSGWLDEEDNAPIILRNQRICQRKKPARAISVRAANSIERAIRISRRSGVTQSTLRNRDSRMRRPRTFTRTSKLPVPARCHWFSRRYSRASSGYSQRSLRRLEQ